MRRFNALLGLGILAFLFLWMVVSSNEAAGEMGEAAMKEFLRILGS